MKLYMVSHIEMYKVNWPWNIEGNWFLLMFFNKHSKLKKDHIISRIYPFNEKCCIYSPWYNLSKSKIKSSVQFCKRESSSSLVSTGLAKLVLIVNLDCMSRLWQYGMWSFQTGGTKLERFLPKNQHIQRKLLNFENWINGGLVSFQKSIIFTLSFT